MVRIYLFLNTSLEASFGTLRLLTLILTISAFECVLEGQRVIIPTEIPASYVRKAEEIVSKSYDHSETFSSICSFTEVYV